MLHGRFDVDITLALMKRFEVLAGQTVVGHSDLELGDPPMGVAGGLFVPLPEYDEIRSLCIAARESSQEHIGLSVRVPGAEALPTQGGVQILDYGSELGAEGMEVHACGIPYPLYGELFAQHVAAYDQQFGAKG